jgi:hypothetical protein
MGHLLISTSSDEPSNLFPLWSIQCLAFFELFNLRFGPFPCPSKTLILLFFFNFILVLTQILFKTRLLKAWFWLITLCLDFLQSFRSHEKLDGVKVITKQSSTFIEQAEFVCRPVGIIGFTNFGRLPILHKVKHGLDGFFRYSWAPLRQDRKCHSSRLPC